MMNKKVAANTGNPFTTPIFPTDFQMKNLIITSFLIFGLFTKAQQIELIENTWYLDKLTINNVDFFPPNNDEVSHSDITASFTNFLVTATSGCNWLNGEAIYGNENIFEIGGEGWNVTLSECELSENQIFEHHYFYEFWSIDFQNIPQPFHYEITLNEDVLSLIVTNSLGSKAYYNNTQLSTSEVSDFVQNDLFLTFKNEDLIFKNSNFIKPYNVQIFNLNGQKLMEFKISDVERMNTSQLPKAIYLIKVIDKKGNIYHKKVRK